MVYLAIIVRVFLRLLDEEDNFVILAVGGLTAQIGGQALINMAVNLQLFPSKGMTLPLISYGGSSFIALSLGIGLLLAFTRRNPYLDRSHIYFQSWTREQAGGDGNDMSFSKHYVLAAGGTGGHMIPPMHWHRELVLRGHRVALITDERGQKIPGHGR